MATSAPLRKAVQRLALVADRDLAALWRQVDSAAQARQALADVLPALVQRYGPAAATLAATWYDSQREKHGVPGRFEAFPADLGAAGADVLAGVGVGPLFGAEPDWQAAKTIVAGGLQRRIANYSRATIAQSSVADPKARGWRRVGDGSSCDFCSMLLSRGAVYTEASADFPAHDHCGCGAEPAWS